LGGAAPILASCEEPVPEEAYWAFSSGLWGVQRPPPPIVSCSQIEEQRQQGCGNSTIRFGDTAAMRGLSGGAPAFTRQVRNLAAAANLTDDPAQADALMQQAIDLTDGQEQRFHLIGLRALLALQHGRTDQARTVLTAVDPTAAPDAVASDLLFFSVLAEAPTATHTAWRETHLATLERAAVLDPTSFQVRAWRVIGWLIAAPWEGQTRPGACPTIARDFAQRLLDLSAAGACPVMIGHLDLAIARHFRSRVVSEPAHGAMVWRQFANGLFSVLINEHEIAVAMQRALASAEPVSCGPILGQELSRHIRGMP
jgi:hypothetical protein